MSQRIRMTRDVTRTECPWLMEDLRAGAALYRYAGPVYGAVSGRGVALSWHPERGPFFEAPADAVEDEDEVPEIRVWRTARGSEAWILDGELRIRPSTAFYREPSRYPLKGARAEVERLTEGTFQVSVYFKGGSGVNAGRYTLPDEAGDLVQAIKDAAGDDNDDLPVRIFLPEDNGYAPFSRSRKASAYAGPTKWDDAAYVSEDEFRHVLHALEGAVDGLRAAVDLVMMVDERSGWVLAALGKSEKTPVDTSAAMARLGEYDAIVRQAHQILKTPKEAEDALDRVQAEGAPEAEGDAGA